MRLPIVLAQESWVACETPTILTQESWVACETPTILTQEPRYSASVCEQALSLRSLWGNYTTKKHVWDFWAPASKSLFFLAATPAPRVHTLLLRASDSRNFPPLVRIAQCADFAPPRTSSSCRSSTSMRYMLPQACSASCSLHSLLHLAHPRAAANCIEH